jgi:hypothetical protein
MLQQIAKTHKRSILIVASALCAVIAMTGTLFVVASPLTYAAVTPKNCTDKASPCLTPGQVPDTKDPALSATCSSGSNKSDPQCIIDRYLNPLINLLSGLVGVVVTISIVYGGIQYASSGGDPGKVSQAKKRILSSIIGLISFLFLYAFLQWIVPGGFL